jgi:hypothetical protein
VVVHKSKPPKSSPTFEKMNQERLKKCAETAESARIAIETSKRLTEASRELVDNIHEHRKKAG